MGKEIIGRLNSLMGKNLEKTKQIFPSKRYKKRNPWVVIPLLFLSMTILSMGLASCSSSNNDYANDSASNEVHMEQFMSKATSPDIDMAGYSENIEAGKVNSESGEIKRKIIQTALISVKVSNVSEALDQIRFLAQGTGGYIVNSSLRRDEEYYRGHITVKVPADKLEEIIEKITSMGEILDKSITAHDVSEEYYDSQARLKVMQKKEERLLALMDKAKNIEEIVLVENELGKVRSDIEVLQGRLKYLDNASSFSEISINIQQALSDQVVAPQGTFARSVQSLINSVNYLLDSVSKLFIGFFFILPWLTILAALYLIYRFIRKKQRKTENE